MLVSIVTAFETFVAFWESVVERDSDLANQQAGWFHPASQPSESGRPSNFQRGISLQAAALFAPSRPDFYRIHPKTVAPASPRFCLLIAII
jgi:hypothetical protein